MHENLGNNALRALESGQVARILPTLDALKRRGSTAEVLGMFDSLTGNLSTSQNRFVRDAIVLCLRTHANNNQELLNKAITWADTTLRVPRESVVDHITRAEAAHLIGYLKDLDQRPSDFRKLGDKLLELAVDPNEEFMVRDRCIQALGRILYIAAWTGLNNLKNSLTDETILQTLSDAIDTLRPKVQERSN